MLREVERKILSQRCGKTYLSGMLNNELKHIQKFKSLSKNQFELGSTKLKVVMSRSQEIL